MTILQEIDKKINPYKGTIYYGHGFQKISTAFYESDSDEEFIGGLIDIGSLISNVSKAVSDNKDTIQSIASTAGKFVDLGKSISNTVKSNQELKKLENVKRNRKKFTPEQEQILLGEGFATFRRN